MDKKERNIKRYAINVEVEFSTDKDPIETIKRLMERTIKGIFARDRYDYAEHYHILGKARELS